jgi:hypothetical protein
MAVALALDLGQARECLAGLVPAGARLGPRQAVRADDPEPGTGWIDLQPFDVHPAFGPLGQVEHVREREEAVLAEAAVVLQQQALDGRELVVREPERAAMKGERRELEAYRFVDMGELVVVPEVKAHGARRRGGLESHAGFLSGGPGRRRESQHRPTQVLPRSLRLLDFQEFGIARP